MKKTIALLLAILLVGALFAGCGPTDEVESDAPTSAPPTFVASESEQPDDEGITLPLVDEPYTFTYWIGGGRAQTFEGWSGYEDNEFYKEMAYRTNVSLDFWQPAVGSERENFQTMILSNELADFIQSVKTYYDGGVDKGIKDGVIQRLNEAVDQWMPNYRYKVYLTEETFIQSVSDEGNLWGIHHIVEFPQGSWCGLGIRQDWLDKAGISKVPETIQELDTALAAFTNYTLDGIGSLWMAMGNANFSFGLNGSYGVTNTLLGQSMLNVDGKATYPGTGEGYKEYAAQMADWWARGLINKDYMSANAYFTPEEKVNTDQAGVFDFVYTNISRYASLNADPDFDLVPMASPRINESQQYSDIHLRNTQPKSRTSNSMAITTQCSNLELACKYWDYGWSEEGTILANWGLSEEDVANGAHEGAKATYGVDPSDENGDGHAEYYLPWLMDTYGQISQVQTKFAVHNGPLFTLWTRELGALTPLEQSCILDVWVKVGDEWVWPEGVTLTADEGAEASSIIANCNTALGEWLAAVIVGEKSADTFDQLQSDLQSMNVARAEELYQIALDRYLERADFLK